VVAGVAVTSRGGRDLAAAGVGSDAGAVEAVAGRKLAPTATAPTITPIPATTMSSLVMGRRELMP
jgi:hypothetical protein